MTRTNEESTATRRGRGPGRPAARRAQGYAYPATPAGVRFGLKDADVTHAHAARTLGISKGFLSEVLKGQVKSQPVLNRLARLLTERLAYLKQTGQHVPYTGRVEVTFSEAMRQLGMSRQRFQQLQRRGLVPPWFRTRPRQGRQWVRMAVVKRLQLWQQARRAQRNGPGA